MPVSIVSDRDKLFTSNFWKEFFKLVGSKLHFSTAYHPQSDGQTERVNQCLENYLRCMTSQQPKRWMKWLSLEEHWYNTNFHSSLKMTPFKALYGYEPSQLSIGPYMPSTQENVAQWMEARAMMQQLLKENLVEAQSRMKYFADKHRSERSFQVGDQVYLKLQPYRQTSLALRRNQKLSAKYYGPYTVIQRIGTVAYKLQLPEGSHIHPVFHVSLLEKKISDRYIPSPELPLTDQDGQFKVYPLQILDRRIIPRNNASVAQVLIHWSNSSPEEATWEDYSFMEKKFPHFDSSGYERFKERAMSRMKLEVKINRKRRLQSVIVRRRMFPIRRP